MDENITSSSDAMPEEIRLNRYSIYYLSTTAPWMKFLSIMGFVFCGLMLVFAFLFVAFSHLFYPMMPSVGWFMCVMYVILAVVMFFPNRYLLISASNLKTCYNEADSEALEEALRMQQKYWKYLGILMIIYLALIAIAVFFGLMAALIAWLR